MNPILTQAEQFAWRMAAGPPYRNDRINPPGAVNEGRPDVRPEMTSHDQDTLPGLEADKQLPMQLWRGFTIPHDELPEHLQAQLMGGGGLYDLPAGTPHGQFGSDLIDHIQNKDFQYYPTRGYGGGTHWSTSKNIAENFSYKPHSEMSGWEQVRGAKMVPVVMGASWDGRGEDTERQNGSRGFPEEQEIPMLPGTKMDINHLKIQHPDTGAWHDVTPEGKSIYA